MAEGERNKGGARTKKDRKAHVTGEKAIKQAERAAEMMDLRVQGWSLDAIGKSQDPPITAQRVHSIIKRELEKRISEPMDHIRSIEVQRLDDLTTGIYEKAVNGDLFCIDRVLAIMTKRAALLGYNVVVNKPGEGGGAGEQGPGENKTIVEMAVRLPDMKAPHKQPEVVFAKPEGESRDDL